MTHTPGGISNSGIFGRQSVRWPSGRGANLVTAITADAAIPTRRAGAQPVRSRQLQEFASANTHSRISFKMGEIGGATPYPPVSESRQSWNLRPDMIAKPDPPPRQ